MKLTSKQITQIVEMICGMDLSVISLFEIKNEMDLRNDLNFDSLDIVELTIKIEKKFNIEITIAYEHWYTVQDVLETIDKILYP